MPRISSFSVSRKLKKAEQINQFFREQFRKNYHRYLDEFRDVNKKINRFRYDDAFNLVLNQESF